MKLQWSSLLPSILFLLNVSAQAAPEFVFELHPKNQESYEVKEDKIYFRVGKTGLILESADNESIARYYQDRGSAIGNPFSNLAEESQPQTIFLLTLINRGSGSIVLTPRYVTLKIKTDSFFPMDFAVFVGYMENLDKKVQDILEKSIFHSTETVPSGKIVSKFLLFTGLPKKFKELRLEFSYLFFENQEINPVFYFTRNKVE